MQGAPITGIRRTYTLAHSLHYVNKWESDLRLQLNATDWSNIWAATESAAQNVVASEAKYKVLMH